MNHLDLAVALEIVQLTVGGDGDFLRMFNAALIFLEVSALEWILWYLWASHSELTSHPAQNHVHIWVPSNSQPYLDLIRARGA